MYVVVPSYSGQVASEPFDLLEQRKDEVKSIISGVPGFVSYVMFRSGDGRTTVTSGQDRARADESSGRAAEWIKENIRTLGYPPEIT